MMQKLRQSRRAMSRTTMRRGSRAGRELRGGVFLRDVFRVFRVAAHLDAKWIRPPEVPLQRHGKRALVARLKRGKQFLIRRFKAKRLLARPCRIAHRPGPFYEGVACTTEPSIDAFCCEPRHCRAHRGSDQASWVRQGVRLPIQGECTSEAPPAPTASQHRTDDRRRARAPSRRERTQVTRTRTREERRDGRRAGRVPGTRIDEAVRSLWRRACASSRARAEHDVRVQAGSLHPSCAQAAEARMQLRPVHRDGAAASEARRRWTVRLRVRRIFGKQKQTAKIAAGAEVVEVTLDARWLPGRNTRIPLR